MLVNDKIGGKIVDLRLRNDHRGCHCYSSGKGIYIYVINRIEIRRKQSQVAPVDDMRFHCVRNEKDSCEKEVQPHSR